VHFLGCSTEAEDIAQEAFVLAYTRLESFRGDSAFYTWLYRIAVNSAISHRRRRRPTVSTDRQLPIDLLTDSSDGHLPEHQLERQESVAQVHQALQLLTDEHREILVLREIEGCDYDAIAEMCDIPIGTVRSRLHRARSQLKIELERIDQSSRQEST
jgi:RNA polymerase sigma-70 factor (ECF subfamily)